MVMRMYLRPVMIFVLGIARQCMLMDVRVRGVIVLVRMSVSMPVLVSMRRAVRVSVLM